MNKLIATVISYGLMFLLTNHSQAGSAIWGLNPGSGDWNTAANWMPTTVPNGPADTAFFDLSNTTGLSISANTEVNGIVFDSNAGLNPFTITAGPGFTFTISGVGITNNSGTTQNFVAAAGAGGNAIRLFFKNSAMAGSGTFFTTTGGAHFDESPGWISFNDISSASNGTFTNNGPTTGSITFGGGVTLFNNSATAANGIFINNGGTVSSHVNSTNGATIFNDTSTAADGTFTNNAATVSGGDGGLTAFSGNSNAGNATITNNGATVIGASGGRTAFSGIFGVATAANATIANNGGTVSGASGGVTSFEGFFEIVGGRGFFGSSTAGNATIINYGTNISGGGGGETVFFTDFNFSNPLGASTAGNATLIANGGTNGGQGGEILFEGFSQGGTSRIEVFGNGNLDISFHTDFVPRPSRFRPVTVGSIEGDGNVFLGANNLTVGTSNIGTTFSGVIQDSGQNGGTGGSLTKIGTGTLDLTGTNTYTGNTNINRGVLKVDGSITSNTIVNRFGTLAGTGTVNGNVINHFDGTVSPGDAPGTLTVNNYTQEQGSTLLIDIAGANPGQTSVLKVLGTADLSGLLDPVLLNGFVPTVGESFTFLDYAAVTGKLGIFDRNIDDAMEHWVISYQPNSAILTVAAGNVSVSDRGSTLLLLTLSLLALLTHRHGLLRKQA